MKSGKEKESKLMRKAHSLKGKKPYSNNDILPLFPQKVKGNTMNEQIITNLSDKANEIRETYKKIKLVSDDVYDYFSDNITSEVVQKEKFFQFPQMRITEQIIYDYLRVMNRQIEELRAYLEGLGAGCDV